VADNGMRRRMEPIDRSICGIRSIETQSAGGRTPGAGRIPGRLADSSSTGLEKWSEQPTRGQCETIKRGGDVGGVADSQSKRRCERGTYTSRGFERDPASWDIIDTEHSCNWSRVHYISCADGKARPIEPGLEPLAHGVSGRVGLLRGYGNAIVPQVAATFLAALHDVLSY
jgi:DNA (cytosine-5)-methyltransferase 1